MEKHVKSTTAADNFSPPFQVSDGIRSFRWREGETLTILNVHIHILRLTSKLNLCFLDRRKVFMLLCAWGREEIHIFYML